MDAILDSETQNPFALKTLSPKGSPPKERVSDPDKAQNIVLTLQEANKERLRKDAIIQGMFDGNAPYNSQKLRNAGQAYRANFNTLEGKATSSSALVPYYDLFSSATRYADVECDYGTASERATFSRIVSEEFDRMLKDYPGFDYQVWAMLNDFVRFGKGYLMWGDATDWRFKRVAHHKVLVPDGTEIDLENLDLLVVLENYPVHVLYNKIRNRDGARAAGWDIDNTIKAIIKAVPEQPNTFTDYMLVQQELNDHDLYIGTRSAMVQVGHLFVREFGGQWSHLMVSRNQEAKGFLFKKTNKFKEACQFLAPFFFEVVDGSWNGASGLGKDIVVMMQNKDRIRCSQIDALHLRNSVLIQPQTSVERSKLNIAQIGALTVLPEGVNIQQSTILGDIEGTLAINRDLDGMLSMNTGIYRPRMEQPTGNPRTAEEVRLQFANSTVLGNSAVNRFYNQLDRAEAEIYRRATMSLADTAANRAALDFQDRCKKRGVPPEALKKTRSVRAHRVIGNGSSFMRQQALGALVQIYPMLPAGGQQQFLMEYVAAFTNQSTVDILLPQAEVAKLPTDQHDLALLENSAMKTGMPVTWTPSQNNVVHAQTHLQAAAEALGALQRGANPAEVLRFADMIGQHVAIHLQQMQADPTLKEAAKVLGGQWQKLAKTVDQLREQVAQNAAANQQAAQVEGGMDGELRLKAAKQQGELVLRKQRQDARMMMDREKHNQQMAIADAEAAAGISRDTVETEADITNKARATTASNAAKK